MPAEPIAIIGSGCRFPGGATTPSKLWDLLRCPPDLKQEIPKERFSVDRYYHPDNAHHGTSNVRHSYFLQDDFKAFDAGFFGIKGVEALAMDPQQRLLLETVYESLESAGLPMENLQGSDTGVFVGNMSVDYTEILSQDIDSTPTYFASGTARSILSNRISYFFDWHGPSVTIDTACSSSLIALHQAVQSLRAGEVPLAIAAGANLLLGPNQYVAESKLKMLSPNGLSQMWDEKADGYARGDGFASVVLKKLSDAIRDGDKIECIVRETGTNQDGRTKGITMPSPIAQAALIQDTYRRAGLDLSRQSDRPQYFEAHGTGTPAGDPVESRAINAAFFGPKSGFKRSPEDPKLIVGSIKTVIGHTEGTAGLASLLKVSLALQNGKVPPNLHFEKLSATVKPNFTNLDIPTSLQDWPRIPEGGVKRASVNSFGFGGANAHAILEEYIPQSGTDSNISKCTTSFTPFLFSAATSSALSANISAYADFLDINPSISLRDVSYTLFHHRSSLQERAIFSASSPDDLVVKLRAYITDGKKPNTGVSKTSAAQPRTLGIFTGQGAQWPRMGAELIESSAAISRIVSELEESLATLPVEDRPSWSLREKMLESPETSQIKKAELSQPLCTALQIILVEAMRHAGITFDAVVGHSSGEIGAAYAAGVITASEAIRIAYYRGFHTHKCQGSNGQPGSMMAVGTSLEDAREFCELDDFVGRLRVAASNSSSSVTISGDSDAIEEAGLIFEDENKFHRALQVDKAYHSHHMDPCLAPYIESLRSCKISPQLSNATGCVWVSSVYGEDISNVEDDLTAVYWANNMGRTVLFSEACESALREVGPFDQVVELGPHPALKGPASQTIEETTREKMPYFGALTRKRNAVEALAECLGSLWAANSNKVIDFAAYETFMAGSHGTLVDLPMYQWDHHMTYYNDSRIIRAMRTASIKSNEILGTRIIDNSITEVRWRNRLSSNEVAWLKHHRIQDQSVFPAAGYIAAGLEGVRELFYDSPISIIKFKDFVVGQALIIPENGGVETVTSLTNIVRMADTITARFTFFAEESRNDSVIMNEKASCSLIVSLGEPNPDALPPRPEPDFQMLEVHEDRFYDAVGSLGFGYTGPFKALTKLNRKMDVATGYILHPDATFGFDRLLIHPAALDAAIQSIILAYCFPGDTRLRTTHLPTTIDSIQFNVPLCESKIATESLFRASVPPGGVELSDINGDVDIFTEDGITLIQLQGLHTKPLVPATAETDLQLFSEFTWGPLLPHGQSLVLEGGEALSERALFEDLERVAYYYLQHLNNEIPLRERSNLLPHQERLFGYVDYILGRVNNGALMHIRPEWRDDKHETILNIISSREDDIDLKIMHAVGENLPKAIRGQMNILEPMMEGNKLNKFYVDALGMPRYVEALSRIAAQISNRYPHMHMLEIGAGTGGATKILLKHLASAFDSYTYTDISSGFFPTAQEVFSNYLSKMAFKILDIEKDIESQGYEEQKFDLVIANLVAHATKDLETTMKNIRRLVKPGGYLLLLEITDNDQLRFGFIFGGLPGWWLGHEEERRFSPCVDIPSWDTLLRKTGFSGIDDATPHVSTCPLSVLLTQAVDDRVSLLREPLNAAPSAFDLADLTIIVSENGISADVGLRVKDIVSPYFKETRLLTNINDLTEQTLPVMGSVLSLVDFDEPIFKDMTAKRLQAFQQIFKQSKNILWMSAGAQADSPYASMVLGIGRNVVLEMSHLRFQFIDFDAPSSAEPNLVAESLLRFELVDVWEQTAKPGSILWVTEPEISYRNGIFNIPRLKLSDSRNARYNASRRIVTKKVDPKSIPLSLSTDGSGSYTLSPASLRSAAETRPETVLINVKKSILRSVRLPSSDFLFVVFGTTDDGQTLVALSDAQSSVVIVDRAWTMPVVTTSNDVIEQTMLSLYEALLAQSLLQGLQSGNSLVILDASHSLARALKNVGSRHGISVTSLSSSNGGGNIGSVGVHPRESIRSLQSKLPVQVHRFANFHGDRDLAESICASLPTHCEQHGWQTLTRSHPFVTERTFLGLDDEVRSVLRAAWIHVKTEQQRAVDTSKVVYADPISVSSEIALVDRLCLIGWEAHTKLPAQIQPLEKTLTFSGDKTYWLVGLTGGLGQSLCRWMVDHGARYIVMTSRNPKVDYRWLSSVQSNGAVVKVFPNDITSRESVHTAYRTITATMPPIGGIAQGAMVLHDAMFAEMTTDKMLKVLRPKVDGSIHLEEIFADTPLDFFVYFSSVAAVTGNKGQSMYAAANMFMTTLAAQRRKRGVAGSAINIGAIMGNGYITRELNQQQQTFLQEVGNIWLSEQDFLAIFAEGVLASHPNSTETLATTTGLRVLRSHDELVSWAKDARFQHLVQTSGANMASSMGKTSAVALKKQLEEAKTAEEVSSILDVLDAFSNKLRTILQIPADREIMNTGLDDLGMDSLVAVEVRSWFLKELSADVTVLQVLSGGTTRSLLQPVKEKVLEAMQLSASVQAATEQPKTSLPVHKEALKPEVIIETVDNESVSLGKEDTRTASSSSSVLDSSDTPLGTDLNSSITPLELDTDSENISLFAPDTVTRSLPLSFGQSRFWFLKHFLPDQSAFNITTFVRMQGRLDINRLAAAVETVSNHHEALRTAFVSSHDQPVQVVLKRSPLKLERRQINDITEVTPAYESIKRHAYDLEAGQTMRLQVLTLSPEVNFLILGYHHINMDGISFEVLFNDIQKAFEGTKFTPGVLQYPDFALREQDEYKRGFWKSELDFWRSEFKTLPESLPLLPLSQKTSRPAVTQYGTRRIERRIPEELSAIIKTVTRKFKVGLFAFYLAVLKVTVARYADINDICIGMADANRRERDVLESIGLYLNLVPLRVNCDPSEPFSLALQDMHQKSQLAFANARVPFDVLLNELGVPRSASQPPLFQVFMNYRQGVREIRDFCGCECEGELLSGGELAYDISFDVVENPGGETNVMLSVQSALYDESSAETLLDSYFALMEAFAKNPASRSNKPALYPTTSTDQALELGNGPIFTHVWPPTISHRIDDMIKENPTNIAITDGTGINLTYAEMGALINTIAAHLENINASKIVGVFQQPTPALICSILAIMKSGRTYVPLDTRLQSSRLAVIASGSGLSSVIIDPASENDVGFLSSATTLINIDNLPVSNTSYVVASLPAAPAALLYTSGSTGTPKGICLSNAALRNTIEITTNKFGIQRDGEVVLQQTAYSFDMALFQTFLALCNGATLLVVPSHTRGDFSAIAHLMLKARVTMTSATPAEYISLVRYGASDLKQSESWRVACTGGEKVTDLLTESFRSLNSQKLTLIDGYGPAETTFLCSSSVIPYQDPLCHATGFSLKPYPNYAIYIVGKDGKPVPIGVSGEVCIGGAGVGLGYLNNAKLTSEKFLANRYATDAFISQGWTTMHFTGDRGRLTNDGCLVLEGRISGDTQVKIRGIRVELEEVENAIMQESHGKIIQAAVSMRKDDASGHDYMVAHVVTRGGSVENELVYLQQLKGLLTIPQYMKPSAIISVLSLPLNTSNKLDRQALQSLPVASLSIASSESLPPTQERVKKLWEKVIPSQLLSQTELKGNTDFFHVGGTSLLLVELQSQFKQIGFSPSIQELFGQSTLEGMASLVEGKSSAHEIDQHLDWETEAALLPLDTYQHSKLTPPTGPTRVVVLTGATGFLGRHILERLLRSKDIEKVYCVAVRKSASELPSMFKDQRVEVFQGDLGVANLGLSVVHAQQIFSTADAIIHNGADVSFMKTYASLRTTNVSATKQIARFAQGRRIPLHFISSASVTQLTPLDEVGSVSMAPYPPIAGADGYISAKWVSERHLELISEAYGLPITIHRPASISGNDSSDLDLMGNLFKFVERLEAVPESKDWKGYFDLISVHSVAAAIVKAVTQIQQSVETGITYQYESGELVYPLSTMTDVTKMTEEFPIKVMALEEWIEKAEAVGLNPLLASYLKQAAAKNSRWAFPKLVKE
ncbi:putative PKS-NRPS protein [Trichoderma virens Gv29-8]|uniref:PKS-NRPS protein n=1 Tax=Hypocrea virens (strain Gv29-8 / FGSC 10586) TaxID=413071 RepID=G9N001_HYPVG|nr:putative PKS-NRPS protein [Trichoderma virens Gv29-8]EHK20225.1 putative PKS-NRPS protein [Trichoderma virens Gv29-8]UKZ45857.1 putative Hybrid PKS-NRPS biosynthetic cluster [Trichoderma virens]